MNINELQDSLGWWDVADVEAMVLGLAVQLLKQRGAKSKHPDATGWIEVDGPCLVVPLSALKGDTE